MVGIYGIMIGHYKEPYERNSTIECHKGFVAVAQLVSPELFFFWGGEGGLEWLQPLE